MRLAVIADIHGNQEALEAVLQDAERAGAERFVVNGDVLNRGPDSVQVLITLLERDDVSFTLGNHDDLLWLWQTRSAKLPAEWFTDPFWGATAWTAEQLQRANLLEVPQTWPMTERLDLPGLPTALMAHGTAEHYRESLSDQSDPERVRELARVGQADLLIASHIHCQADAWFGPVRVVNTGAVGSPADGDPRAGYLLLTAGNRAWQVELRRVSYDRQAVLERFGKSGLLSSGLSAEIFMAELQLARSLYTPYWLWTENQRLPRNRQTWQRFEQQWQQGR